MAMLASQEQAELDQALRASTEENQALGQEAPAASAGPAARAEDSAAAALSETNEVIYNALWEAATPADILHAGDAVNFFSSSGLSNAVLGDVWAKADTNARGSLVKDEFYVALRLIAELQAGTGPVQGYPQLAGHTEAAISRLVEARTKDANPPRPPAGLNLSAQESVLYAGLWTVAVKNDAKDMGPMDAVAFLSASGLSNEQLGAIWELADCKEPRGRLSQEEFFIALKLIALQQSGIPAGLDNIHQESPMPDLAEHTRAAPAATTAPLVAVASPATATPAPAVLPRAAAHIMKLVGASDHVSGADLRDYLFRSDLPQDQLATIWAKADTNVTGSLDLAQLETLLGLLSLAQQQKEPSPANIDSATPAPALRGVDFPADAPQATPATTCEEQASQIISRAGLHPTDMVHGTKLREILMLSGLPQDAMADIWGKADSHGIGQLSKAQLQVLLGMLHQAQNSRPVDPATISPTSLAPSLPGFN